MEYPRYLSYTHPKSGGGIRDKIVGDANISSNKKGEDMKKIVLFIILF